MSFNNLFVSFINITLKNKAYETKFQTRMFNKNKISNPIVTTICLSLLILLLVEVILAGKTDKSKTEMHVLIVALIRIGLSLVSMIVLIVFQVFYKTNQRLQIIVTSMNYFTFSFNIYFLRKIYFNFFDRNFNLMNLTVYFHFLLQYIWLFFELIDFKETLITNLLLIIITSILNSILPGWWIDEVYNTVLSHILRLALITYSYLSMRNARYVFHSSMSLEHINEWYRNVLDNINSGFIKVIKGKISFCNKYEIEWLVKRGVIEEADLNKSNIQEIITDKSKFILDNIINNTILIDHMNKDNNSTSADVKKDAKLMHISIASTHDSCDIDASLNKIKRCLNDNNTQGKFTFLGNGSFMHSIPEYTFIYELYARRYNSEHGEHIEMILKDITRNQIIKKKNEEIQIKSVFLSKLFHEFKNPLLCLSEMVEEETHKLSIVNDNSKMIKSLISYLLILVKDLDYFSEMQKDNDKVSNSQINISRISFNNIINFVQMITKYLLKKLKKDKVLSFKIITSDVPTEIETDEIKLKQILINLISNAIKFTHTGSVMLEIQKEDEDYIRFNVNDTGEGIPYEYQSNLFGSSCHVKKIGQINNYGAGLGLTITKDISSHLGKPIEFSSIPGKGSSFWFSIRTTQDDEHSLLTICLDSHLLEIDKRIVPNSERTPLRRFKTYNILIVDDEDLIRKATKRMLNHYAIKNNISINVTEAIDGIEVLWNVYRNYEQNGHKVNIDIIISDENMGLYNGQATARKLNKIENKFKIKHIQYYISSANTSPLNASAQVDGFLHKPLISSDLTRIFDTVCL